jgi:hypothetical protein
MTKALANLPISAKIYLSVSVLVILLVGVSATMISALKENDRLYSALGDHEAPAAVEEMRIRGDVANFGRQMNNLLLLRNPPAGLDTLEKDLESIRSDIEAGITRLDASHRGTEILAEMRRDMPLIARTAADTFAIKRSGDPDQDDKCPSGNFVCFFMALM